MCVYMGEREKVGGILESGLGRAGMSFSGMAPFFLLLPK